MSKHGLGRGLGSLIPQIEAGADEPVNEISVQDIIPNKFQPRRQFDEEKLADLADSIRQYGIIQPIVVRRTLNGYELVAGERRWRAAQMARLSRLPAVFRDYSDAEMMEIALIENLQRQNLNVMEEAMAFQRLIHDFGLTQEEVSRKVGRSRSLVANTIRLLNLPDSVQAHVSRGTLTMGQVKPLLALEDEQLVVQAAEQIIEDDLTARDAEVLVKRLAKPKTKRQHTQVKPEFFLAEAEDRLKILLGTQVHIKPGKMKSKIEIEYYTPDDLERLIEILSVKQMVAATKPTTLIV